MFGWLTQFFTETTGCESFDNSPAAKIRREIRRNIQREQEYNRMIENLVHSNEFKHIARHLTYGGNL